MRVLLSTYGSRGDVEPLVGLGVALQALGAEAVVSAPGDQEFVDLAARAGVELAPAFMPVRAWIADAKRAPADIATYAMRMIGRQYEAISAAASGCDAIVATGLMPSMAAAQCVAEKMGISFLRVSFCPQALPSEHHRPMVFPGHPPPEGETDPRALWEHNGQAIQAIFGPAVNMHRASVGLPTIDNVRDHVLAEHAFLASDPVLGPWLETDLSQPVQTGAWILPDERALPAELEAFLDAGEAPVYVGFGSMATPSTMGASPAAIAAIRTQGRRAIVARGWAELGPVDGADDCFAVGDVNQQRLFPRVAAAVHHGGAGTTTAAARAGAPQVIVPQVADQPFWAAQTVRLGIGAPHVGPTPTVESLATALEGALRPEMRERARVVAETIRSDGAMVAARLLLGKV